MEGEVGPVRTDPDTAQPENRARGGCQDSRLTKKIICS